MATYMTDLPVFELEWIALANLASPIGRIRHVSAGRHVEARPQAATCPYPGLCTLAYPFPLL